MKEYPSQWACSELTCRDVATKTSEYLEDHLPLETKISIARHLSSCPHCRAYLKQVLLVRSTVAFLPGRYSSPSDPLRLHRRFACYHHSRAVM
jgi:predicted anti-sigma-YlaC factor YlaD